MQTDKDLFNLIKDVYSLNPRPDFILNTEVNIRKAARKLNRKKTFKRISFASSGFLFCIIAVLWIFPFSGDEVINKILTSFGANNSTSTVLKKEPLIYIYHSHNQESFFSETQVKVPNDAFHPAKNITLVGERLSEVLNKKNITNIHDTRDIMGILKERGLPFYQSYIVSRESLSNALKNNKSIKMVIDIHRDSHQRKDTTTKINGKDYARIAFFVSRSSIKYEENLIFAKDLHNKIQEKYPGLSIGVMVKSNPDGQSTYNQDLMGESVLMDIGGVENTLIEEYRTVDVFAGIIEELIKK
jgi:stage II sporulation protein P